MQIVKELDQINLNDKHPSPAVSRKFYEVATTLGKLTIEVAKFSQFIIIVVTYSNVLKLDGYLQVAYPTPYNEKASVINLAKDQGQMDNENLVQMLQRQTKCPIFLSYNIDELNRQTQLQLLTVLRNILGSSKPQTS